MTTAAGITLTRCHLGNPDDALVLENPAERGERVREFAGTQVDQRVSCQAAGPEFFEADWAGNKGESKRETGVISPGDLD